MLIANNRSLSYEEGIVQSEEITRFADIFSNATYVFAVIGFNGMINYINPVLPAILGINKDCILNKTIHLLVTEYVHPNDINLTIQALSELKKGQRINGFENRYRTQNGSYMWLSWMLIPFANEEIIYAIAHDITEQRGMDAKLEKSSIKIENIFNDITDSFYALDEHWKFIYVNKSAAMAFAKVSNQTILGKNYQDIFPNDDFFFSKLSQAALTQKPVHFEAFSILTEGWVTVNVYPSAEGMSVYFKDISKRKKLEKSLEDERKRLYALLDGLPGLVYLKTIEGKVIFANHNFKEIHGEPENRKCYDIIFHKNEPCSNCHIQSTSGLKILKQRQCVIKDSIFEVYQHPFYDSDGTQLFLTQMLDITERKIAEEEIARLDRLNLVGELAASIAHEVRNPMTTVRGFLQILKSRDTLHENVEYFDLMIGELDRANGIITEFLSIAKTKQELYTVVKLNTLVDSLYPLILADATNQDKQIILETEDVTELTMNEREIRQLVLNLTRNGLEAMSPRGILRITTYEDQDSIILAVQDQGVGISDDIMVRIGTPFLTTKEDGTGLGLSMCYRIADRHNAKIDVKSSSLGTTFFVKFNK